MRVEIQYENARGIDRVALLSVLGVSLLVPSALSVSVHQHLTGAVTPGFPAALDNASAAAIPSVSSEPEYELESPDFVPESLRTFEAGGFLRRNRWA